MTIRKLPAMSDTLLAATVRLRRSSQLVQAHSAKEQTPESILEVF